MLRYLFTALFVVSVVSPFPAFSEFRVWEGMNGSMVEAEMVSSSRGKVNLRRQDGKVVSIPVIKLSVKDQEYIAETVPPDVEIEVDVKTKSAHKVWGFPQKGGTQGFSMLLEETTCNMVLTKGGTAAKGRYFIKMVCVGRNVLTHELSILQEKSVEIPDLATADRQIEISNDTMVLADPGKQARYFMVRTPEPPDRLEGCIIVLYNAKGRVMLFEESDKGLKERVEESFGSLEGMPNLMEIYLSKKPAAKNNLKWQRHSYGHMGNEEWWWPLEEGNVVAIYWGRGSSQIVLPQKLPVEFSLRCEFAVLVGDVSLGVIHALGPPGYATVNLEADPEQKHVLEITRTNGRVRLILNGKKISADQTTYPVKKGEALLFSMSSWGGAVRLYDLQLSAP